MTHLGEQLSALVDGELTGAELDRANAHLASCVQCRTEAADLRQLKRELRALFEVDGGDALTRRLLAMAGPGGPVPSPRTRREEYASGRARDKRPRGRTRARTAARSRGRYVLWSAASLLVVGVGTAAFTMGGAGGAAGSPAPKITPQLEMFSVQHAIISGSVPYQDPTQGAAGPASP